MAKHILTIMAFMVVTFAVQGTSHFVINKAHFDAISFTRAEPIMEMGFLVMLIQGTIMSAALSLWAKDKTDVRSSLMVAYSFGMFLVSYVAFTEPAKYVVVSISSWIIVEGIAGVIQYGVFGLLMAMIHIKFKQTSAPNNQT